MVLDDCANYFLPTRNPYRRWFDPLDKVIKQATGCSYYDSTACHLDLVQWATSPVWGALKDNAAKRMLLDETHCHLVNQLECGRITHVLLNGNAVISRVIGSKLADLEEVNILKEGNLSCRLFVGNRNETKFIGWSTNLQSSYGVPKTFRPQLAECLKASFNCFFRQTSG